MIDLFVNYLSVSDIYSVAMDNNFKPKSWLTKDKKMYYFQLICCNCGKWFSSSGDISITA